jgi:hypothetical protein
VGELKLKAAYEAFQIMALSHRYIALFDILGFKSILDHNEVTRVAEAFVIFKKKIEVYASLAHVWGEESPIRYSLFSDTVFLYSIDDSPAAFEFMTLAAQMLLGNSLTYGLPMRGAITKGDVFVDNDVFIGQAIVDAYLMEQQQEWIGCWVADDCVSDASCVLTRYRIPLKSGPVTLRWAINWGPLLMLRNEDLEAGVRARFLMADRTPQDLPWDVERKIINTLAFLKHVTSTDGQV